MGRDLPTRNPSIQSPSSSTLRKDDCHLSKEDFGPRGAGLEVGGGGSCKPDATRAP